MTIPTPDITRARELASSCKTVRDLYIAFPLSCMAQAIHFNDELGLGLPLSLKTPGKPLPGRPNPKPERKQK